MAKGLKFKEYRMLDETAKLQFSRVGAGHILRRFDRTPLPEKETDIICPHFMLLAWANGCHYNCSWCYLKGTFRFYGQKPDGRVQIKFKDRERIRKVLQPFLATRDLPPEIINTGELSDSLMQEGEDPFSVWLMNQFVGGKHKILFLSKSINVRHFLENDWQKNAILSWSVNASKVAERWEKYAPPVEQRLGAAKLVVDAGYEVRLRIDPMVPVSDWRRAYTELIEDIFKLFEPERVTLGCLRGLTTTIMYAKDKSWVKYLTEKSNWGKKPPFSQRHVMYSHIINNLREKGLQKYGICKDTLAMWKALQMKPTKIKCNCIW